MERRRFLVGVTLAAWGGVAPSHAAGVKKVAMLWRTTEGTNPGADPRAVARSLHGQRGTRDEEARAFAARLEPFGFRLHRNLEVLWFDVPILAARPEAVQEAIARMVAARPDCIVEDAVFVRQVARATRTIPIVTFLRDPVAAGLAKSISRPGGNVTGIHGGADTIELKSLDFLRRAMPGLACVGWIGGVAQQAESVSFEATARRARLDVRKVFPDFRQEGWQGRLAAQFASLRAAGCTGVMLYSIFPQIVDEVTKLALRHGIAVAIIGGDDNDIERDGLLLRFIPADDMEVTLGRLAAIVARILKGERPADIPFEGPSRFQLAVNLRTARRIGVTMPSDVMVLADRVID
jgi:putative ABC transport system substrate-binding protein